MQSTLYKGADAEKLKSRRNLIKKGLEHEELNEKESYWIRIKESYYIHNKGYNMTAGGNNRKNLRIFSEEQNKQIFEKYKSGASMKEISKEYSCSITAIKKPNINPNILFARINILSHPLLLLYFI